METSESSSVPAAPISITTTTTTTTAAAAAATNDGVSTNNSSNSSGAGAATGGPCILCKCGGYEPSPTNPMRFCVCSHGRSCHPQKKTIFSSAMSQAAIASSTTNQNQTPQQQQLSMANRRKSARLEFWQKLEEGTPAVSAAATRSLLIADPQLLGGGGTSAQEPPPSGRDNYNPYRSISPGSFKKQSSRNSFYVTPSSTTTTIATATAAATTTTVTATLTSSMTSKSTPIPTSAGKRNVSPPPPSSASEASAASSALLSIAKPSTSRSESHVSKLKQQEASSDADAESSNAAVESAEKEGSKISSKPKLSQREMVLAEIFDTEQQYVDDLNLLVLNYIHPLQKLELLAPADIQAIFSNAETILQFNSRVLSDFNERRATNPNPNIGDIFVSMSQYFKIYTMYCSNHDNALKVLERAKKNPQVAKFFEEQYKKPQSKSINCEGFLIRPIQRLCKYPLLLRELIKNTPEDHEDYQNLVDAQAKIDSVVTYVNEGRRSAENNQKVLDIQASFDVDLDLVSPSRKLLREGKLLIASKGRVRTKDVYLFNDLLLIRRSRSKAIMSPIDIITIIDLADTETLKNAFEITHKDTGDTIATISFQSPSEKKVWFREIKKMVEAIKIKEMQERRRKNTEEHVSPRPSLTTTTSNGVPKSTKLDLPSPPSLPPDAGHDTWIFGLLLWERFSKKKVFENSSLAEMIDIVQNRKTTPPIQEDWPPQVVEVLQLCFHSDPSKRPTFAEIHERLDSLEDTPRRKSSTTSVKKKSMWHR